jgi:hypothetical protein
LDYWSNELRNLDIEIGEEEKMENDNDQEAEEDEKVDEG